MRAFLLILALALPARAQLFEATPPAGGLGGNPEAAATLVVYNTSDSDSGDLARFYAAKRGIPKERVLGLNCPLREEI